MLKKYNFILKNLDCANCAREIEEGLKENKELHNVVVNFNTLRLSYETDTVSKEEVIKKVLEIEPEVEVLDADLKKYEFSKFKESHPFINQIGKTTISENGLNDNLIYIDNKEVEYSYSFNDFIYELEKSSLGLVSCAEMIDYKKELNEIYKEIIEPDNMSWIVNHPEISTYDICKDITKIFANNIECHKETITENVEINLLDWNLDNKPVIRVTENKKNNVYPENAYDDIEVGGEYYEDNIKELKRRYEDKLRIPNKEKSFNYLPYRMDSSYEFNFLDKTLRNLTDKNMEVYYNGYKNEDLNSLKIITPYGKYTPDFVFIRRDKVYVMNTILNEILK